MPWSGDWDAPGQLVEHGGGVGRQLRVRGEQPQVLVEPGRAGVVVARADVDVAADPAGLLAHHQGQLDVGLEALHPIGDVGARLLQLPAPGDVGGLVEAGGDLHQYGDLLAPAHRVLEGLDDGGIAAGAVDGQLDRQHAGVGRGALQEVQDGAVEAVVGQVDQDVAPADLVEDGRWVGVVELKQTRVGHRLVGRLAQLREPLHRQAHEVPQAEQPLGDEDVLGTRPRAGRRASCWRSSGMSALTSRRTTPANLRAVSSVVTMPMMAPGERSASSSPARSSQGSSLAPRVTRKYEQAEPGGPREQGAQVGRDHLLQRHPAGLIRERDPAGAVGGDLDAHEAAAVPARAP